MTLLYIMLAIMGIGIGSHYFFNDDNLIEEQAEEMLEDTLEEALNLPDESLDIDFTYATKEQ